MRRRGLSHADLDRAARHWDGPYKPYDLVRELVIAVAVVVALAVLLTIFFSSPDERPSTIAKWSQQMPVDFVSTALSELDGSSDTAGYGPPYNHAADGQHVAFVYLQKWLGVSHPVDTAADYVYTPLKTIARDPALTAAVVAYRSAGASTQSHWTTAYAAALEKAHVTALGAVALAPGSYGPLPTMMNALLGLAQSGGLDGVLLTGRQFYQTDYTRPLLLMADGSELADRADQQHLLGSQWGMMNETGSYPGQVWLWLYTFWYQIQPFSTSDNADALVMLMMGVLSLAFILIPFLPGVRDIPRWVPLYRMIWRDHYREQRQSARLP